MRMLKMMVLVQSRMMVMMVMVTQIGPANVPLCAFLHFLRTLDKMLIGSIITPGQGSRD